MRACSPGSNAPDVDQWRDNYNFYRDREAISQRLLSVTASDQLELGSSSELLVRAGYDRDEIGQSSLDGQSLAGTREDRFRGLAVLTGHDWVGRDRTAMGIELGRVEMGLPDRQQQNLIVDDVDDRPLADNTTHTYVERESITSAALFAEYARAFGSRVTVFAGLRFDAHPFWPKLDLRAAVHSGFRGAVGVHYAGGFRRDGLLSEKNFDAVEDNPRLVELGYRDLDVTRPERMYSAELGALYRPTKGIVLEGVGYLDHLDSIIDVGVIFVGDEIATAPENERHIGTDVVGDWGGWFFFKNNHGAITSGGAELSARWTSRWLEARASLALSRILALEAAADQIGSMYVSGTADDPHFRAYPERVARASLTATPSPRLWISSSVVHYGSWYAPAERDASADGGSGAWIDLTAGVRLANRYRASLLAKNVTNARALWPMNSNANDPGQSVGSPALEPLSLWATLSAAMP